MKFKENTTILYISNTLPVNEINRFLQIFLVFKFKNFYYIIEYFYKQFKISNDFDEMPGIYEDISSVAINHFQQKELKIGFLFIF